MRFLRPNSWFFFIELAAVFSVAAYVLAHDLIGQDLFFLAMSLAALIFALFYGLKGALAAGGATAAAAYFAKGDALAVFLARHYLEISFWAGGLILAGMVRSSMTARVLGAEISTRVLNQRLERLTVELSEKDHALREAFRTVLADTDSPAILYQALRRIEKIQDRTTLFEEALQVLYRHCHVEKAGIFEPLANGGFHRVATFGPTQLPETMSPSSPQMPEILRVVRQQREVIVPIRIGARLTMAVPILGHDERLLYVVLVEEIRFINFNDTLIHLLKLAAFWLKYLVEGRLAVEAQLASSAFASVIVYRPELARRMLARSLASHRRYRLPYAMLKMTGPPTEAEARTIASGLRLHDELFWMPDDHLVILLSMIQPQYVGPVQARLSARLPDRQFQVVGKRMVGDGI